MTTSPRSFLATRRQVLLGAAALAALTACGTSAPAAPPAGATRSAEGDFGPVEVPAGPQRVVAGYDTDTDVALVLGLPLVGAPGARGSATLPFPEYQPAEQLTGVSRIATFLPEPSFESIAALGPDCIIDGAFGVQERYDSLSRIAPTLSYSTALYTDWRDGLRLVAEAFDRTDRANDFIDAYTRRADDLRARVEQRWPSRTTAVFYADGTGITADIPSNQVLASMIDCGFVAAPDVVPTGDTGAPFSLERLSDLAGLDALVLMIDLNFEAGETTIERDHTSYEPVINSPLWPGLPAVAAGRVFDVPAELGFTSPLTAMATLDFVEDTLLAPV